MENLSNEETIRETIGVVLKELREQHNYSQGHVCHHLNRSTSWLSMVESGKTTTTLDVLTNLLNFYEIPLSQFFELVERRSSHINGDNLSVTVAHIHKKDWQPLQLAHGMIYLLPPYSGILKDSKLDITPIILKPGCKSGIVQHVGEEILYILEGKLILQFYEDSDGKNQIGQDFILEKDEAVHFYTSMWHQGINQTEQTTRFLVVRFPKVFP